MSFGSAIQGIWAGTKVLSGRGATWQILFYGSDIVSMTGRSHSLNDVCLVSNGDTNAWNHDLWGGHWSGSNISVNFEVSVPSSQQVRVQYLYIARA